MLNSLLQILNMIETDLQIVFYTEIFRNIVGLLLLGYEINSLNLRSFQKTQWSLLFILVFHNFMYFFRALGILQDDIIIRQLGPTLSAFISAVLILYWTGEIIGYTRRFKLFFGIGITLSLSSFVIGRFAEIFEFVIIGLVGFVIFIVYFINKMLKFIRTSSPYVRARKRVFLMALAFVTMALFEGMGVATMYSENYEFSSLFFILELSARILMTLSIVLPIRVQTLLGRFIK